MTTCTRIDIRHRLQTFSTISASSSPQYWAHNTRFICLDSALPMGLLPVSKAPHHGCAEVRQGGRQAPVRPPQGLPRKRRRYQRFLHYNVRHHLLQMKAHHLFIQRATAVSQGTLTRWQNPARHRQDVRYSRRGSFRVTAD